MALKFLNDIELEGKKVIARFDFNVPLEGNVIKDSTRIDRSLETIQYLLDKGAKKIIMMSHLGRPKGEAKPEFSLEPVAKYLAQKLGQEVLLTESCLDAGIKTLLEVPNNNLILLQNLRYHAQEEKNDPEFAKKLASYADIYVNDAFGAAHRKHASTYEINRYFKNRAVCGLLMEKEVKALGKVVEKPEHPFVAVLGGAKVSDKIKIIESLLPKVDKLIIGGAMAYPFLKAQGQEVGKSLCSDEDVNLAKSLLKYSTASKIILPVDHIASTEFGGPPQTCDKLSEDLMGLDIGEKSIHLFTNEIKKAKTVLWNGPMGLFENSDFSKGTFEMAKTLGSLDQAFTLVGGGDSVRAINESGESENISHVSTGGGASLEFIENGTLPGLNALKFGIE